MPYAIILVTAGNLEEAQKISHHLLEEKLIACCNIINNVQSSYWWQGKIEASSEALIIMKTHQDLFQKVSDRVKTLHSYSVPEIIMLPIMNGNPSYLAWIDQSLS